MLVTILYNAEDLFKCMETHDINKVYLIGMHLMSLLSWQTRGVTLSSTLLTSSF